MAVHCSVGTLIDKLREEFLLSSSFSVSHLDQYDCIRLHIPVGRVVAALGLLVRNAVEAGTEASPVELEIRASSDFVTFVILDSGPGISAELLHAVREPFITTKSDAGHMGLGIYTASLIAESLGGTLKFESREPHGLRVLFTLPRLETNKRKEAA